MEQTSGVTYCKVFEIFVKLGRSSEEVHLLNKKS